MKLEIDKKALFCAGLILIILLGVFILGTYNPPVENHTVTVNGISFNTPIASNATTDKVVTPAGNTVYSYEDEEHNISVYVSAAPIVGMEYPFKYDEKINRFTQQTSLGDKFVGIEAKRSDDLDMILGSLSIAD